MINLGPPMPAESAQKQQLLWSMITEFIQTYKNQISGKFDKRRNEKENGISGGAKIKLAFYNLYTEYQGYKACSEYNDLVIKKAIQLHEGDGLPGYPSVDVFIFLISPQLEKLRDPGLDLVTETYMTLENIASTIVNKIFQRFPSMIPEIMEIITRTLG